MHAQRYNTTTALDVLPAARIHRWRRWPATPKPDAVKQLWKDLTPSTKVAMPPSRQYPSTHTILISFFVWQATLPMLVPMTVWCLRRLKENKPFGETTYHHPRPHRAISSSHLSYFIPCLFQKYKTACLVQPSTSVSLN